MSLMETLAGRSRVSDAQEDERIKRLWNSLINPAPKPLGRIGSNAGADIVPFPALPGRAALYQARQTARSSCDPSGFVAGPKR